MDTRICDAICSTVGQDDDLWIIGDFAFTGEMARPGIEARFASLPGRKHLVVGNHDLKWILDLPWDGVHDIVTVKDDDSTFVLCHYPMITWNGARRGAIQLFDHVHHNWKGSANAVNVGVDVWGFTPVSRRKILERARHLPVNKHWHEVEPRTSRQ